jgi:hypothetical protein
MALALVRFNIIGYTTLPFLMTNQWFRGASEHPHLILSCRFQLSLPRARK